jgi:hypothetical protein
MRTKKIENPAKLFRSVGNSVGIRADGHVSGMRGPSVMPSVFNVSNSIGIHADGHVACMRGPSVMLSVLPSVYVQTDTCQACVRQPIGSRVGNAVSNPSVIVAKSRNFFATLCEIPMGYIPSIVESEKPSATVENPSVNVAKSVIFLQLSVKYRRFIFRRYIRR